MSSSTTDIPLSAKSVEVLDDRFKEPEDFLPIRTPGLQIHGSNPSKIDPFELFFDDNVTHRMVVATNAYAIHRMVVATNAYAESKKDAAPSMYSRFKLSPLSKEEMMRYIGVLLLLSLNSTRNYRKAWDTKSS